MDNFTQIQMNDSRENDVSTPYKADLQQFTPEQIVDHCNSILDKHLSCRDDGKLLFTGVQIIKQLQEELKTRQQGCDGD